MVRPKSGNNFFVLSVLLTIFSFCNIHPANSVSFIPTESEYFPFLVNGWDAKRKNVLVFKDPYCPYCIKAIPKLEKLNSFNVFVFWAPILGEHSVKRVDDIFQCSTPVSKKVFSAMMVRKSPNCDKPINEKLKKLNDFVVDNYDINAVPSVFMQGKQVSLAQLIKESNKRPKINDVQVNWNRFKLMQQYSSEEAKTLALLIPDTHEEKLSVVIEFYKPEFVFLAKGVIQKSPSFLKCKSDNLLCMKYKSEQYQIKYEEFTLLFGSSLKADELVLIDRRGNISYQ
jgi:thiol-disulfide isomerase/thioredoxin